MAAQDHVGGKQLIMSTVSIYRPLDTLLPRVRLSDLVALARYEDWSKDVRGEIGELRSKASDDCFPDLALELKEKFQAFYVAHRVANRETSGLEEVFRNSWYDIDEIVESLTIAPEHPAHDQLQLRATRGGLKVFPKDRGRDILRALKRIADDQREEAGPRAISIAFHPSDQFGCDVFCAHLERLVQSGSVLRYDASESDTLTAGRMQLQLAGGNGTSTADTGIGVRLPSDDDDGAADARTVICKSTAPQDWSDTVAAVEDMLPGLPESTDAETGAASGSSESFRTMLDNLPPPMGRFVGRSSYVERLEEFLASDHTGPSILTVCAPGGAGKSALVRHWLRGWDGAKIDADVKYFGYSFYDQGHNVSSSQQFIARALEEFSDCSVDGSDDDSPLDPVDREYAAGRKLAELLCKSRSFIVLDGMECLQGVASSAGSEITEALLRDQGLLGLMRGLSEIDCETPVKCLITSRHWIDSDTQLCFDHQHLSSNRINRLEIKKLDRDDQALAVLTAAGVDASDRSEDWLQQIIAFAEGSPLTLTLLGRLVYSFPDLDDDQLPQRLKDADAHDKSNPGASRLLNVMHQELDGVDAELFRLMGVFDCHVKWHTIRGMCSFPPINGVSEELSRASDVEVWKSLCNLRQLGVVAFGTDAHGFVVSVHPVVRESCKGIWRSSEGSSWKDLNERLFAHYLEVSAAEPSEPEEALSIVLAVKPGCEAGLYREAYRRVVQQRLVRTGLWNMRGVREPLLAVLPLFFKEPEKPQRPEESEVLARFLEEVSEEAENALHPVEIVELYSRVGQLLPMVRGYHEAAVWKVFSHALEYAESLKDDDGFDDSTLLPVIRGLWGNALTRANIQECLGWVERAKVLEFELRHDASFRGKTGEFLTKTMYGVTSYFMGRVHEAHFRHLAPACRIIEQPGSEIEDSSGVVMARCMNGLSLWLLGYTKHAEDQIALAEEWARDRDPWALTLALYYSTILSKQQGDAPTTINKANFLRSFAIMQGYHYFKQRGHFKSEWGESQTAEDLADRDGHLEEMRLCVDRAVPPFLMGMNHGLLADGYLESARIASGDSRQAYLKHARERIEIAKSKEQEALVWKPEIRRIDAKVCIAEGREEEAREALRESRDACGHGRGLRTFELRSLEMQLQLAQDDEEKNGLLSELGGLLQSWEEADRPRDEDDPETCELGKPDGEEYQRLKSLLTEEQGA